MARTKASSSGGAYRKVLAGRAPRKVLGCGSLNAGAGCSPRLRPGQRGAGNAVCVRPVPGWQRGIGEFLRPQQENRDPGGEAAGGSGLGRPGRERWALEEPSGPGSPAPGRSLSALPPAEPAGHSSTCGENGREPALPPAS